MGEGDVDFCCGFICQSRVSRSGSLIHVTPGVKLDCEGDGLGQQYVTPRAAVIDRGADIIVVGRGITEAQDPLKTAQLYQQQAYDAYLERTKFKD